MELTKSHTVAPAHTSAPKDVNNFFSFNRNTSTPLPFFQPKLSINVPGDVYEQQADAVAEKVMASSTVQPLSITGITNSSVQKDDNGPRDEPQDPLTDGIATLGENLMENNPLFPPFLDRIKLKLWDQQPAELRYGIIGFGIADAVMAGTAFALDPNFRGSSIRALDGVNLMTPIRLIPHADLFTPSSFTYRLPAAGHPGYEFNGEFDLSPYFNLLHGHNPSFPQISPRFGLNVAYNPATGSMQVVGGTFNLDLFNKAILLSGGVNQFFNADPQTFMPQNPMDTPVTSMLSLPSERVRDTRFSITIDVPRLINFISGEPTRVDRKQITNTTENEVQRKEADEKNPIDLQAKFNNILPVINRKESTNTAGAVASQSVEQVLAAPGMAMEEEHRNFMEERFQYDFSKVKIHDDSTAHQSASDINAYAYTNQHHIVFGEGQYRPATDAGKKLLAHELTHVVQQGAAGNEIQRSVIMGSPLENMPGIEPFESNSTNMAGLLEDNRSIIATNNFTGIQHLMVFTQSGLSVFGLSNTRVLHHYARREGSPMLPAGFYNIEGSGHKHYIVHIAPGTYTSPINLLAPEPARFSAETRALREGIIGELLDDYLMVRESELIHEGYFPAMLVVTILPATGTGTSEAPQVAHWANTQSRALIQRLGIGTAPVTVAAAETGSGSAHTPDSTIAHSPDRLIVWARADGNQYLNVWVGGAVVSLLLRESETIDQLQQRVSTVANQLHDARDPSQSTEVNNGAQQTGFTDPVPASRPQTELPGSGIATDPEQQRLAITNATHHANWPPYPARINNYGTNTSVTGGNNRMSMEIDYSIAGSDMLSQVAARMQHISYYWEIFDVTNVVIESERDQQTHGAAGTGEYIGAGSGEGNALSRSMSNIYEDQAADLHSMDESNVVTNAALWQVRSAQLALMAVSSIVRSIGSLVSSYVSIITAPLNERNIGWDNEGEFIVRCVATPAYDDDSPNIRASSVGVQPVKVMNINTRAAQEVDRPANELALMRQRLAIAAPGHDRDELMESIARAERIAAQTTLQNVAEQLNAVQQQLREAEEIITISQTGAAPATMSIGARLLRVQLALNGVNPQEFKEHLQTQVARMINMQNFGTENSRGMRPPIYRPAVVLASEENGQVFNMVTMLAEKNNSTVAHKRYRLVDLTSPNTQDYYEGESTQQGVAGHSEAITNAFIHFRENNGYGRGTIAIRPPANIPAGVTMPSALRSAPGARGRWIQRLQDLATAAEVAGLVLSGPAGMVVGLIGGVAGAAVAVDSLMRRQHGGRFSWNFQTVMEITGVVGGVIPFIGLSRRFERTVYYIGIAQLGQSALAIPIQLEEQLHAIEMDMSLPEGERRARRAEAFLQGVRSGVVLVVSAQQMAEHGVPAEPVEPTATDQPQTHEQPVVTAESPTHPLEGTVPEIDPAVVNHPDLHRPADGTETPPTEHAGERRPQADPEEATPPTDEPERERAGGTRVLPGSEPIRLGAADRLRIRINEILSTATLSEHASQRERERVRTHQIRRLIEAHPDLAIIATATLMDIGSFNRIREMVRDSYFGEVPEANQMAQNILQEVRTQVADNAMRNAVEYAHGLYPQLTPHLLDMGTPGFASDRDVTLQFRGGGEAAVQQRIDASLQAVRRAYDNLRSEGIEPDAVLDTNFYTELHEASIRTQNPTETAQIGFDQSVVSLSELRMGMNAQQWAAYRDAQRASLTGTAAPNSSQGRMESEARVRLEAEFTAAENLAARIRPEGQTSASRETLLLAKREALGEALRRNAPAREIRQLMAEIKLLEPEAYGTRAAVESVPGRQQAWARGTAETYMTGRQLPAGRVERMTFLAQDASANAGLLFGHSQSSGNQPSAARSSAKYLQRVAHAVVVDGRLPAGSAREFMANLQQIIASKSINPASEANAATLRELRASLTAVGHSPDSVVAMTDAAVTDAWVAQAREIGLNMVVQVRTAEQMMHVQEGGPNPLEPSSAPQLPPTVIPERQGVTSESDTPPTAPVALLVQVPAAPTAASLPVVPLETIPSTWQRTQLPSSGGNDVILYRGFARNAQEHMATVVREGEIGGILTRAMDTAQDAVYNQVGRDPVLSGDRAAGVVSITIPAVFWDALVTSNSISERGNYPGFSRNLNSTEIRVNSVEAGILINSLVKVLLPPDSSFDFR